MAGQKTISVTSWPPPAIPVPPPPPPPPPDYIVTGNIIPVATGNYFEDGIYNGVMSYKLSGFNWFIWKNTVPPIWELSSAKGSQQQASSWLGGGNIIGNYSPQQPHSGTAVVSAGH